MGIVERVSSANNFDQGNTNTTTVGYNPNPGMARPTMSNPLSEEEMKLLLTQEDVFNLQVSPVEIAKAVCTHKHPNNGQFATVPGNEKDGDVTCSICHQKFYPDLVSEEYVQAAVDCVLNVLQTIKMIGVDLSNDMVRQYFTMIPYITRIPKLYKIVNKSFQKYNQANPVMTSTQPNIYGLYNSLINPNIPLGVNPTMYGMQNNMVNGANPFYAAQPQYGQQPQYGYGYGYNQQPQYGYGAQPQYGYNPYATQMNQQGNGPQPPVGPAGTGPVVPNTPPLATDGNVTMNQPVQL